MQLIKIGGTCLNTTVGAFKSNCDLMIQAAREMAEQQCTIGSFQEQTISGYPGEDLNLWGSYVDNQWAELERFCTASEKFAFPTVFSVGLTVRHQARLYNCAAIVQNGRILGIIPKEELPTYGVFYERRVFSNGLPGDYDLVSDQEIPFGDLAFKFSWGTFSVAICEDIWREGGPLYRRASAGVQVFAIPTASPFRNSVHQIRENMLAQRSSDNLCVLAYFNQYGGNDSLAFDGGGYVYQNGNQLLNAPSWESGTVYSCIVDLSLTTQERQANTTYRKDAEDYRREKDGEVRFIDCRNLNDEDIKPDYPVPAIFRGGFEALTKKDSLGSSFAAFLENLRQAALTSLEGYYTKTGAFKCIVIALSGGFDSILTLLLVNDFVEKYLSGLPAKEIARQKRNMIHCISLPTRYNAESTRSISRIICEELGVTFIEQSIQEQFEEGVKQMEKLLGPSQMITPIALQNLQARIRSGLVLTYANCVGGLMMRTSNMSETATGYYTVGGDSEGGYSLIHNMPKTVILALVNQYLENTGLESLRMLQETKPSAELAEDQEDERDLMPFEVLDRLYCCFVQNRPSAKDLYLALRTSFISEQSGPYTPDMLKGWTKRFLRLFFQSIWKWRQVSQGTHLDNLDLDPERSLQLPTVSSMEWLGMDEIDACP